VIHRLEFYRVNLSLIIESHAVVLPTRTYGHVISSYDDRSLRWKIEKKLRVGRPTLFVRRREIARGSLNHRRACGSLVGRHTPLTPLDRSTTIERERYPTTHQPCRFSFGHVTAASAVVAEQRQRRRNNNNRL